MLQYVKAVLCKCVLCRNLSQYVFLKKVYNIGQPFIYYSVSLLLILTVALMHIPIVCLLLENFFGSNCNHNFSNNSICCLLGVA